MKRLSKLTTLLLLALPLSAITGCVVAPSNGYPRTSIGASVVDGRLSSFYLSLGEYYRVPERDVLFIHERHIPDYDIPVVLFISQHAHIAPAAIIDLRLSGISWMDISLRFGLTPDIFYVPVQSVYGSPYGNAYGHYQRRQRSEWHKIRLADDDIMNLVNLRFISERQGVPPEEVMRMRSSGRNFVTIHDEVRRRPGSSDFRQQERGNAPEPVMRQERREQEIRQQDRNEIRERERAPVIPQDRPARESPTQERRDSRPPAVQQIEPNNGRRQQERVIERESVIQQNRPVREDRQGQTEERRQTRSENRDRTEQINRQVQEPNPSVIRQQENKAQEPTKQTQQEQRQKTRQQERRESQDPADRQERKGRSPSSNGEPDGR